MHRTHLNAQAQRVLEHIEILNRSYGELLDSAEPEIARVLASAEAGLRALLTRNSGPIDAPNSNADLVVEAAAHPA